MVSLAAASVIENARATPSIANAAHAPGNLADGGVPAEFLEAAVGVATKRRGQPVSDILVVVEALRLLARDRAKEKENESRRTLNLNVVLSQVECSEREHFISELTSSLG